MVSNTNDFTKLFKESQYLRKIREEQQHKTNLNKTVDEGVANFRKNLILDVNNNSVKVSYLISKFDLGYGNANENNKKTICSEFASMINEKLVKFGFTGFRLLQDIDVRDNYCRCSVSIRVDDKPE